MPNNLKVKDFVIVKSTGDRKQIESITDTSAICIPYGDGTVKGTHLLDDLKTFDPDILLTADGKTIIAD